MCLLTKDEWCSTIMATNMITGKKSVEYSIMMYKWSEQVKFHPWVGDNFNNSPRKVLLLGDSHYGQDEPYGKFTVGFKFGVMVYVNE